MGVKASSKVWETACRESSDKLVLLALADHANDDGVCYPGLPRLAGRTGLALRTVRTAVRRLCEDGLLSVERNAGPHGCNVFTVLPERDKPRQPLHPGSRCTPAANDTPPRQPTVIPPAAVAPEPSRTIKEPSRARQGRGSAGGNVEMAEKDEGGEGNDFLEFWAGVIHRNGRTPPSALKRAHIEEMIDRGLVTVEQLRACGLSR